ncbi:DUF418 domain-containing protein [Pyxidicoccus fallax]|uniref:DUF418 domain-containing protein n=1 Tax=Pyxidicoccus fallax TaxID=394095 RepID=A0A848LI15_9BACT|nr:DUF418 domain-containing protein [Pyxidicoccus fallax]NMO17038.1 DUF418 domain-containing protein [Pyxidicoccus fallax]NPC82480.1 DUF418 domain-containing protein [Pyxidicoccus fallax]
MSENTPPTVTADTVARPVGLAERVVLLDALRGFALFGVFLSNSITWFSGRTLLPREQAQAMGAPMLEMVVGSAYQFLVNQKFITIFAFLFGLGFSIQMTRAEARGSSIVPLYLRRLLILMGIGFVHLFAIWVGDILHTYAMVGFLLLLFRARSHRAVLGWAVGLMVTMSLVLPTLQRFGPVWLYGAEAAAELAKATQAEAAAQRAAFLEALSSHSLWTAQAGNGRYFIDTFMRLDRLKWMGFILARFLFGLLAGRLLLLQDVERHRPLLRRLVAWGLSAGVVINGTGLVMYRLRSMGKLGTAGDSAWMFYLNALQELGFLAMAAGYVALFALLFQRVRWQRVLGVLGPVGRMALSQYLLQSVVSVCIYNGWGLGLIGKLPSSRVVAICFVVFAVQVVLSHWWLARFRFGPAEWLWRSLTYGRAQPMRLSAREGTAEAPVS